MFESFLAKKHHNLISKCLKIIPSAYVCFQCSKPTCLYFLVLGLDVLDKLDAEFTDEKKREIIQWLYDQQFGVSLDYCTYHDSIILDESKGLDEVNGQGNAQVGNVYECAHLAQTYTSLCCLLALGDDLSSVDKHTTLKTVAACQKSDGSFCALSSQDTENDMRFVFCAVAVSFILNDFSYIDVEALLRFIRRSVNYDGGIGQAPHCESHGGSTYCAVASLFLLGQLWDYSVLDRRQIERLKTWAIFKQDTGFHGRTNKPDDSCYAFWIGATLAMLNAQCLINETAARGFLMFAQDEHIGGFSKYEDSTSDILHTCFGLAALGLLGEPHLQPIFAPLNITHRAYERLLRLHATQLR